jgi:hypothetical protein
MVELPGSLERSTLGDVLGALHRDRVTGTLTLQEAGGGHQHVIVWRDGLIHHVETTRRLAPASARSRHAAAHWTQSGAERAELLERLEALFQLTRARLSFRVMGPRPPRSSLPLGPSDFLHGRRRSRDAAGSTPLPPPASAPPASSQPRRAAPPDTPRARALRTLGLQGEPGVDAVRAAFRQLARRWHPDRHPGASEQARVVLCQRFAQISGAYEQLIGNSR